MIWGAALLTGLAGSLHCAGMCGPIALALPVGLNESRWHLYAGRILYNAGRILSYALMGALMGSLGSAVGWFGWQQYLSIGAGIIILLFALGHKLRPGKESLFSGIFKGKLNKWFATLMKNPSYANMLSIGILNGFLPCGLVYIALAGAVATGNAPEGAAYMAIFGLGTFPLMFLLSLGNAWMNLRSRLAFRKVVPYLAVVIGILFILRGLNLGIPYLSPKMSQPDQEIPECCHPQD